MAMYEPTPFDLTDYNLWIIIGAVVLLLLYM